MKNKRVRAYELVVRKIQEDKRTGRLTFGDKLPSERELAKVCNVSRTSVREALQFLEQSGFIETKRGKGSFIKRSQDSFVKNKLAKKLIELDETFVFEMLEFRSALETEAAYLAAQRAGTRDVEKILKNLVGMEQAEKDVEAGIEADVGFHLAIVEASHNSVFIQLCEAMETHMKETIRMTREHRLLELGRYKETLEEHKELYYAIASKDSERARALMKTHIAQIRKELSMSFLKHS